MIDQGVFSPALGLAGNCEGVEPLLRAKGIELRHLPPYSPDLNPIEMAIAKLKAHLRQSAARNLKKLVTALANSLDTFSAADQPNAFLNHPAVVKRSQGTSNL